MDYKKKFNELYNYIVSSSDTNKMKMLGRVMKAMMQQMIDNHTQLAAEYINVLESVKWDNYLTEKEADTIISAMQPSPKWSKSQWEKMMNGADLEHVPFYNKCALYVTMSMIDSDDGPTIAELMGKDGVATNDMDYFGVVHKLALNKLKDKDKVFDIRRYFHDML